MSGGVSLPGGAAAANFTGVAGIAFTQAGFGANSVIYTGGTIPQPAFPGQTLIIDAPPGANITIPDGYGAFYDASGGDTVTASGNVTAFLGTGLNPGTDFVTGGGNDLIFAGGADTITAGSGSDTIIAGSGDNTVVGGTGSVVVDARQDDLRFVGVQARSRLLGAPATMCCSAARARRAPICRAAAATTLWLAALAPDLPRSAAAAILLRSRLAPGPPP